MIPIGKFGFLVLNLEMSPSGVDVNVHPAKLEVRFVEEQKVFKAVYCAIQDTLLKAELVANTETPITGKFERNVGGIMETEDEPKSSISGLFRKISKSDYDFGSNNVIESIYRSKTAGTNENKIEQDNQKTEPVQVPVEQKNNQNVTQKVDPMENMDLADKLASIKAQLNQMNEENAKYTHKGYSKYTNIGYNQARAQDNSISKEKEQPKQEQKIEAKPQLNTNNSANTQVPEQEKEQIKNTISELMQMGKGLTAEQIREKIAKIAEENKNKVQNTKNEEATTPEQTYESEIKPNPVQEQKKENIQPVQYNSAYMYTRTTPQKTEESKPNNVAENETKYNTKYIDTREIQKLAETEKKADIEEKEIEETQEIAAIETNNLPTEAMSEDMLLSIIQEKSKELVPQTTTAKFDDMYEQIFGQKAGINREKEREEAEKTNANDIINSNMSIFEEDEEYKDKLTYRLIRNSIQNIYNIRN